LAHAGLPRVRATEQRVGIAGKGLERDVVLAHGFVPALALRRLLGALVVGRELDQAQPMAGVVRHVRVGIDGVDLGAFGRRRRKGRCSHRSTGASEPCPCDHEEPPPPPPALHGPAFFCLSLRSLMPSWFMRSWTRRPALASFSNTAAMRDRPPCSASYRRSRYCRSTPQLTALRDSSGSSVIVMR